MQDIIFNFFEIVHMCQFVDRLGVSGHLRDNVNGLNEGMCDMYIDCILQSGYLIVLIDVITFCCLVVLSGKV